MENNNEANNLEKENQKNIKNNINKGKNSKKKLWIIISIFLTAVVWIIVYTTFLKNTCSESYFNPSHSSLDKPIIYLYPEKETTVSVNLGNSKNITCSYPLYKNTGWKVKANTDGNLVDLETGRSLYALYYESKSITEYELENEGFIVKRENLIKFLEEKLAILGLTERESEEFIIYWLPRLEANAYNYIRFSTSEEINENMPLNIEPNPDTIIRVLMTYKGLQEPIEIKEQDLITPDRNGFTVVEWGGTEIK